MTDPTEDGTELEDCIFIPIRLEHNLFVQLVFL